MRVLAHSTSKNAPLLPGAVSCVTRSFMPPPFHPEITTLYWKAGSVFPSILTGFQPQNVTFRSL